MLHKENKKRYILRFPTDFQKKHVTEVHYMLHNEKKKLYITISNRFQKKHVCTLSTVTQHYDYKNEGTQS